MRSRIIALLFGLLVLPAPGLAQEDSAREQVVPLADGGFVAFKSEAAGTGKSGTAEIVETLQGGFRSQALVGNDRVIHRVLMDQSGKYIFGYDLLIQSLAASKKFNITVKPLDKKIEDGLLAGQSTRIATLPKSAKPQIMDDGDSFALDLLVNQSTGVKIIDFVKVSFERSKLWNSNPSSLPPRDFTLDAVALRLVDFRLLIDGNIVSAGKPGTEFSGALLWCYVEGQGRFIFSLVPRDGYPFQKNAIISDNKIEFMLKGRRYEWLSSSSILPGGGSWNVWVLHDPKYVPFGQRENREKSPNKLEKLEQAIKRVEDKVRDSGITTFERDKEQRRPQKSNERFKVMVGAADSIENLWPRNN
jgi:hypothetical protein